MNDPKTLKLRTLKYILPVTALSVGINITKFLEIDLVYEPMEYSTGNGTEVYHKPRYRSF